MPAEALIPVSPVMRRFGGVILMVWLQSSDGGPRFWSTVKYDFVGFFKLLEPAFYRA